MKSKRIPISAAKNISQNYEWPIVVIFACSKDAQLQHITTYGQTIDDCEKAAKSGNNLKKHLGWPDSLCNATPSRIKKRGPREP